MKKTFGPLAMVLKNAYVRGNTIIYQRAVPKALRDRYPGRTIKLDLKTNDFAVATRKVRELNERYEAEWQGLLESPEASPASLKAHADALLKSYGLSPGQKEIQTAEADAFITRLQMKQPVQGQQEDEPELREYLDPVEIEALKRLQGKHQETLSAALELHIALHKKRDNEVFSKYTRRAFNTLIKVIGDKAVSALSRDDARKYINDSLKGGAKTTTVRRRLGVMHSVLTTWRLEKDPKLSNPFEKLSIANEGTDTKKRVPFTYAELLKLDSAIRQKDDDMRWILAMLSDTGARLAEVVGLSLTDIVLDAPVPYVHIQPHPWRRLKNSESNRKVPLVGATLWAAKRVVANAEEGATFAFPRYASSTGCKTTSASGALAKWIRSFDMDHTAHEYRHAMADRLREVQCPREIRYAIDGHAHQDVGDRYGTGHGLWVLKEWLDKVAL